jgi:hypothetical protein
MQRAARTASSQELPVTVPPPAGVDPVNLGAPLTLGAALSRVRFGESEGWEPVVEIPESQRDLSWLEGE